MGINHCSTLQPCSTKNEQLKNDIRDWKVSDKHNNIRAYEQYLAAHTEPQFKLEAEQNIENLKLDQSKLPLTIKTVPAGAKISIKGVTSPYFDGIRLLPNKFTVDVKLKGYDYEPEVINLNADNTQFTIALNQTYDLAGGVSFTMQSIPAGRFSMGSYHKKHINEHQIHPVQTSSFKIMQTEVTRALWQLCVKDEKCDIAPENPTETDLHPVTHISYEQITTQFIPWLNEKLIKNNSSQPFKLPTEAQWEYAARAGSFYNYSWGDKADENKARFGFSTILANYRKFPNKYSKEKVEAKRWSSEVASYPANKFGLFDMHGNVEEWVEDCWSENYDNAPRNAMYVNSIANCEQRAKRGGSWKSSHDNTRTAKRNYAHYQDKSNTTGFRLVQGY